MNMISKIADSDRYGRCIRISKNVRWDIDLDVIRGRKFDTTRKYMPDGLSLVARFPSLSDYEMRLISQIQGRTYANMFGLIERCINAEILEISRDHWFSDQVALEALVRLSDEELKHQELFRRVDAMIAEVMPDGYQFDIDANQVAGTVLGNSNWAVLALTLNIELVSQLHYRQSIEPDDQLSPLFKDLFLYHWKEESQHAIIDELEWVRHDDRLTPGERDKAIDELIGLFIAVDGIVKHQAAADARYFAANRSGRPDQTDAKAIEAGFLEAYRWQFLHSGAGHPHFGKVLSSLTTPEQRLRIHTALAALH